MNQLSRKEIWAIGLMMFALFLGAGNMIFPPMMGLQAGNDVWTAVIGFLITGVGLPLMGVAAVALAGGGLQDLASRVDKTFGVIFTVAAFLAIGPLLAIPRTSAVAYEIGVVSFLPDSFQSSSMIFIFSFTFFALTYWLALNPSKLVDRFGKFMTPVLLTVITILFIKGVSSPLASVGESQFTNPLSRGFLDGYNTMDAIASLIFGLLVIARIRERGVTDKRAITKLTIKAGVIAAAGLSFFYVGLAYLGSTSGQALGPVENGGQLLAGISQQLLGTFGLGLLSVAIFFATLTTSVGLVSSTGEYFTDLFKKKIPYPVMIGIITAFSFVIANTGLTTILKISVPILVAIYPVAIVIILLTLAQNLFGAHTIIYKGGVIGAGIISLMDGVKAAGFNLSAIDNVLSQIPLMGILMGQGLGWIIPSAIGIICGAIIMKISHRKPVMMPDS
ncbi:branched-chain amino acid transport system II carrier protein [Microaerobacter geothermalis]|uniref:branched-chain amino acid transport system II carrier protein n=1 Tax=Microaerobacter geothermalis TaxID=674972 RepID=UPI001F323598|nr:branched-chain amino acid transport system II carrier protein [Microaerobacter geothermalis]MCF6094936.1 branched-chain amino acid transport system II carrier protein [Microaerobacter geothermalis]